MRAALAFALLALPLAGCAAGDDAGAADGHYVFFNWNQSISQCHNDACTYGKNQLPFSETLECDSAPELSWDVEDWVHGSVTVRVKDDAGTEVASKTLSADGTGSQAVEGKAGIWTFEGSTSNANGNLQIRLTCG